MRHGNNLPFPLRVSFVLFVSLWLILFEPQRHKEHKEKRATTSAVRYSNPL